jgi:hypothetical protein
MKKIVILIGVATFLAFNADTASACFCATIGSPESNLADAQAVFQGKVVAAKKGEWTIAVDRVWKGEVEEKVLMRDPSAGTSCESRFKLGESYIFFADIEQAKRRVIYHPRICTWTTSLTYRHEGAVLSEGVTRALGESTPPSKKPSKEKRRQ